jgi:hypothetical protein
MDISACITDCIRIHNKILSDKNRRKKNKERQTCRKRCIELIVVLMRLIFKCQADDNRHMNSLRVHHRAQFVLSFVQLNDHDEAFLERCSILSNNLDQHLEKKYKSHMKMITNINAHQLQYEQIMLIFALIMTRYVNYGHYVHLVIEKDHQPLVCN